MSKAQLIMSDSPVDDNKGSHPVKSAVFLTLFKKPLTALLYGMASLMIMIIIMIMIMSDSPVDCQLPM